MNLALIGSLFTNHGLKDVQGESDFLSGAALLFWWVAPTRKCS